MTLVAAFASSGGTLLFADTQETVTGYSKRKVDKLTVYDWEPFRFGIAGAADDARYLDVLQAELANSLFKVQAFDLKTITVSLTDTLTTFYGKHIWPQAASKPQMEYMVVIQPRPSGWPEIFHVSESAVTLVPTSYKSIGIGSYLSDYLQNLLHEGGESLLQVITTAVYIAREVREHIDGVGPVERIGVFHNDGTYNEVSWEDIETIEKQIWNLQEIQTTAFKSATREPDESHEAETRFIAGTASDIRQELAKWYAQWSMCCQHAQRQARKRAEGADQAS